MQCKRVFIRCVHLTGTQSTLYKNNKVNKIYSQPSGQWITSNYINELQHFTEHHCIVAKQYLVIFRGSWRVSSEGCADRIPDLSRGDVDLCDDGFQGGGQPSDTTTSGPVWWDSSSVWWLCSSSSGWWRCPASSLWAPLSCMSSTSSQVSAPCQAVHSFYTARKPSDTITIISKKTEAHRVKTLTWLRNEGWRFGQ